MRERHTSRVSGEWGGGEWVCVCVVVVGGEGRHTQGSL